MRVIFLAPLIILGMVACSKPQVAPQATPPVAQVKVTPTSTVSNAVYAAPAPSQPAWIDAEVDETGLVAVGIASRNPLDDKGFQRTVAIADARNKLAGKVQVRVQNMFSALNQTVAAADGGKAINTNTMQRVQEGVTRQLINLDLMGANTRYFWRDPQTGDLYTQIFLSNDKLNQDLSHVTRQVAQGEVALNHALDKLDTVIASTVKTPQN